MPANDPVRFVAFDTLEQWANDISRDIAEVIQARCDIAGDPVPEHIRNFVESYTPTKRQLASDRSEVHHNCGAAPSRVKRSMRASSTDVGDTRFRRT